MKPATHQPAISQKLESIPVLPSKKGLPNLPPSPKPKGKYGAKSAHAKMEPMVLRSPPTGESMVLYALPIPLNKTKELLETGGVLRRITRHLKKAVSTLEDVFGAVTEDTEQVTAKAREEGLSVSLGDDMDNFMACCSEFAAQLEKAMKEERDLLDSLFKWFQQQVNQLEEISKDQAFEAELLPLDQPLNIVLIVRLMKQFEKIRKRLKLREKNNQALEKFEAVGNKIEEFIKTYATQDLESPSKSESSEGEVPHSISSRLNVMIKIFEKQANMLERALNDQGELQEKYKQMQSDFELLSQEKSTLESEIQKWKDAEKKPTSKDDRKKAAKIDKKKDKERVEDSRGKLPTAVEIKTTEEFLQVQKEADVLKSEKRALQDQLRWALQEVERSKNQLEYVLNQRMEMLKAEGASRASMQTSYSRTKVGYGDSKTALAERQSRTLFVSHPSKYAEVIYDEEEDESPEVKEASSGTESNYYVLVHKDMPSTTLPEPEKSDNQDSLPETSSQDKEAGASFANAEERSKADELENFQITTDQPYSDIGSFEEYEGESEEKVQVDDDTKASPEVQLPKLTRKQARRKRRRAFFITVKSPDNLTMLSRTPSEIENLEATRYEYIYNESKEPQKNIMPAQEDSKAEVKIKKQKHKTTKVSSQGGVVDEDQERTSKVKLSDKKQETSKQKKHSTPGAIEDINQESATKVEKQSKKVKIPKKERPSSYDRMPHKALEPGREDLVSKAEVQVKKLKPGGEEHAYEAVSRRTHRLEGQDAKLSTQAQSEKQASAREDILTNSVSETQEQAEKETTSGEARQATISSEIQEKGIPLENLKPEEKLLLKGSQSQVEILGALEISGTPDMHGPLDIHGSPDMHGAPEVHGTPDMHRPLDIHGSPDMHGAPEVRGTPDMHEALDIHGTPDIRGAPEVRGSPYIRGALDIHGTPDIRGAPEVRGSPSIRGALDIHGTTDIHGAPGVRGAPEVRGSPSIRGALEVHGSPSIRGVLEVRGSPSLRGVPEVRGSPSIRGTPEVRGSPYVHGASEVRGSPYLHGAPEILRTPDRLGALKIHGTSEKFGIFGGEIIYEEKTESMTDDTLLPETSTSEYHPHIKKQKIVRRRSDQNVDETFTLEDLQFALDNKSQASEKSQSQRFTSEHAVSEVLDIPEDLVPQNPSITDIIFHLDLNRVVETDLEDLKSAFGKHLLKSEMKSLSKTLMAKDSRHQFADGTGRSRTKLERPSFHGTGSELSMKSHRGDLKKGLVYIGDMSQDDLSLDYTQNVIKGTKIMGQVKPTLKSSSRLWNAKDKSATQESVHKSAFPTKVVTLSPFENQDIDSFPSHPGAFPRPLYRSSRGNSIIPSNSPLAMYRNLTTGQPIQTSGKSEFPKNSSMKKRDHKGYSKYRIVNDNGMGITNNQFTESSSARKRSYKGEPKLISLAEKDSEYPNDLHTMPFSTKKRVHKAQTNVINLGEEGIDLPNNLHVSTSPVIKTLRKEHAKPINLNEKSVELQNNLSASTSTKRRVHKEMLNFTSLSQKGFEFPSNQQVVTSKKHH